MNEKCTELGYMLTELNYKCTIRKEEQPLSDV